MNSLLCPGSSPTLLNLFDITVAPPLLFYAYIPIFILCIFFGIFVYIKDAKSFTSKYFLAINVSFTLWILSILVQWTASSAYIVHFAWQTLLIPELAIYMYSVFFGYAFLNNKDIPFSFKSALSMVMVLGAILLPTTYNISSFDLENCQGNAGLVWQFVYVFEIICIGIISLISYDAYKKGEAKERGKVSYFSIGLVLFLFVFWSSNYFGELTKTYQINLIGPIGMTLFLAFMTYIIASYKMFRIKLFSSQVLVVALWILIASLLFIQNIDYIHIAIGVTAILVLVLGIQLIRSVAREIEQREKIEKLAIDLERANERLKELDNLKSEFLSFASHQIRSPLTAIRGYTSMALEGDFGDIPDKIKETMKVIDTSTQSLVVIVNEFLDISRIEQGRVKYEFIDFDAAELTKEVVAEQRPNVENRGLTLDMNVVGEGFITSSDKGKIKQVIGNVIDNSVKYTPKGSIHVEVSRKADTILISVKDTGIGIDSEDFPKLFSKFTRAKDANKTNVMGTGLGLYVAKQMLEALQGKIWVESKGKGFGSTFFIELTAK